MVRSVRIAFCYPLVNGYMAACWRELAARPDVELFVLGFASGAGDLVDFGPQIMAGLHSRLLVGDERRDGRIAVEAVTGFQPDIIFVSGWSEPALRALYFAPQLAAAKKVMLMDNQFRGDLRQAIGGMVLQPLLRRIDGVFVTGERSWQFARRGLRTPESRIFRGCVAVDHAGLGGLHAVRAGQADGWPRRFFFAGRYQSRKALDVLVEAYRIYRERRPDPWALRTAGMGPDAALLADVPGVEDVGFVAPHDMGRHWAESGAFVLASRFDAWPLVIAEAASAGLPVVATEACGSTVELVRHLHNGYVSATEDAGALAEGLCWIHDHREQAAEMGRRSVALASAYSAERWADRVLHITRRLAAAP